MITRSSNRVQTGFRLDAVTLARVKTAAKLKKISVNTYVNDVLKEATQDIESEEEKEALIQFMKTLSDTRFISK